MPLALTTTPGPRRRPVTLLAVRNSVVEARRWWSMSRSHTESRLRQEETEEERRREVCVR